MSMETKENAQDAYDLEAMYGTLGPRGDSYKGNKKSVSKFYLF